MAQGPFTHLPEPPRDSVITDELRRGSVRELAKWFSRIHLILSGAPGIAWDIVSKAGSKLSDIATRPHSQLQTILQADDTSSSTAGEKHVTDALVKKYEDHRNASQNVHGIGVGNSVVGTGTAQTLSQKKFSDGIVIEKTAGLGVKVDVAAPTFPWQDLHGILRPDSGGANSPTLAAYRGGVCREYFYAAADKMDMDFHIMHDYVPGTDIFIHLHWGHNGTAISGNMVATFTYSYAKGHNQATFPAEKAVTITYNTVDIATTPQYVHRIDEVQLSSAGGSASLLDSSLIEPDGIITMNLAVTTIPTITGGTQAKPFICFTDIHYQSTGIGSKQKAPNFYV